jgi:hypothetical protein
MYTTMLIVATWDLTGHPGRDGEEDVRSPSKDISVNKKNILQKKKKKNKKKKGSVKSTCSTGGGPQNYCTIRSLPVRGHVLDIPHSI